LDRYWAWRAGLGWIGKNTQLIIPKAGSSFFLGELFIDIELAYDTPLKDRCGNCNRCQQACPTQAFEAPHKLDARKCLSYVTIESREDIPIELRKKMGNRIGGISLQKDIVIPYEGVKKALGDQLTKLRIRNLEFDFDYSHEIPFPTNGKANPTEINRAFNTVFADAAAFLA
jgi:NAD-dependent dihydropyrimidine dehydrogenase PreA subunit